MHQGQNTELAAQWGFLKNIINIDTFFSSGGPSRCSSGHCSFQERYGSLIKEKEDMERRKMHEEQEEKEYRLKHHEIAEHEHHERLMRDHEDELHHQRKLDEYRKQMTEEEEMHH